MKNDRIAKKVYIRVCAGSCSVSRLRKRWIDTVKECLKKRGLNVKQARSMVHDKSVWRVCEVECMGYYLGDKPFTLTKFWKGRISSVANPTT